MISHNFIHRFFVICLLRLCIVVNEIVLNNINDQARAVD